MSGDFNDAGIRQRPRRIIIRHLLLDVRKNVRKTYGSKNDKDIVDIGVSCDGSWLTRGHTSNIRVGCVIDLLTGFVLDYEVMSKRCGECEQTKFAPEEDSAEYRIWYEGHQDVCSAIHVGSSGAMEVNAAVKLWERSESIGFRYTNVLSDGDSKSFLKLKERNVHGSETQIKEVECINHVSKKLGTALRQTVRLASERCNFGREETRCQVIYSQFGLASHQNDHQARRRFVEWAQNEIAVVPAFHKRILFSDEAHFWLNGYVNKQNCRIWSEANPQVYVELHPEKLTVWCALWAGGIIGPYFFKNDEGHNELWFQQDCASCHTARAAIDLLKDAFGDRLISRFGPVNWPPRSCDLTPIDYFLWGYAKSLVYADKPQTLDHLEDNIRRVIRPQMLEKVIENWTSRLDYIRASRGSPMPEIIFKM
ncbi:uncharacterized protein TNCV_4625941 [Trichonephila clavipes]|nr:uncharacterized protein TNCV_4625941 [Trichonephila clavipes]